MKDFALNLLGLEITSHHQCKLICWRHNGIRGRRLAIYKTECSHVEKNYWSTVHGELPQEVFVYQHLEKMIEEGKVLDMNVTRMVTHEVLTTTTAIRCHDQTFSRDHSQDRRPRDLSPDERLAIKNFISSHKPYCPSKVRLETLSRFRLYIQHNILTDHTCDRRSLS
jgi:hypothetical protein